MDAIQAAYESASDRMPGLSLDDFRTATQRCAVHPVTVGGEVAGAVLVSGDEIHACILPWARGRWFGREQARVLNAVIAKHGHARTSATTPAGVEFVERLGFVRRGAEYVREVPYGH